MPVTIIGGATVQVGQTAITRAQALDRLRQALPAEMDPATVQIMAPQQPLAPGVRVSPALGDDDGVQNDTLSFATTTPQ